MTAWYRAQGKTLARAMDDLYAEYGFYRNDLASFTYEGADGMAKMQAIMEQLRKEPPKELDGEAVTSIVDYKFDETGLPKSNVLQYQSASAKILVRPSGTEPKVKLYLSARADSMEAAAAKNARIQEAITKAYLG